MARRFFRSSSQYLNYSGSPVSAYPVSMACWFWQTSLTTNLMGLVSVQAGTAVNLILATSNSRVRACTGDLATALASSSANHSPEAWRHACGVWVSSTERHAYLSGGFKGTNTNSRDYNNTSPVVQVGRATDSTSQLHYDGLLADAAIWSAALTDAEVRQLAQGVSPLLVRPQSLAAYWPLHTPGTVQEFDLHPWKPRRYDLTVNGATPAEHPAFLAPPSPRRVLYAATAGSAGATYAAPARVSISCGIRIG